jgi:hypothetical protein
MSSTNLSSFIEKKLCIFGLPVPTEIQREIQSFLIEDKRVKQHKKHMRKICYMFQNARESRYVSETHREKTGNILNGPNDVEYGDGEFWKICLSRRQLTGSYNWVKKACESRDKIMKSFDEQFSSLFETNKTLRKEVFLSVQSKQFEIYEKRQKKLEEKTFGFRNCKKCGCYKSSQMAWLYSRQTRNRFDMDRLELVYGDELSHTKRILCQCA